MQSVAYDIEAEAGKPEEGVMNNYYDFSSINVLDWIYDSRQAEMETSPESASTEAVPERILQALWRALTPPDPASTEQWEDINVI